MFRPPNQLKLYATYFTNCKATSYFSLDGNNSILSLILNITPKKRALQNQEKICSQILR